MKKIFALALTCLVSLSMLAQKQINDPNAEQRSVGKFHGIKASHGIEVILTQGSSEALAVSASTIEYRQRIITEVKNGVLHISYDRDFFGQLKTKNMRLKAYVSAVNLDMLDLSSGASINIEGELKVARLDIDLSSGARIDGTVHVEDLTIDQSSGSMAELSGTAGSSVIDGSSGSVFNGYELVSVNCRASGSSGSSIKLNVEKELSVEASSGSSISYKGNGVIRNVRSSSGGQIARRS